MIYLLDANSLITAKRDYFQFDRVPEYWEWLLYNASNGAIKVPTQVMEEILSNESGDDLQNWVDSNKDQLLLSGSGLDKRIGEVLNCYCDDPDESELEQMGADPFLIAAALSIGATVVTKENSAPKKQRANKRIPDICANLSVPCVNDFKLIQLLDFRTGWRRG